MVDPRQVEIPTGGAEPLAGELRLPDGAIGLVVFSHGSGSGKKSPRGQEIAEYLAQHRLASLLVDLLTASEAAEDLRTRKLRFDLALLGARLRLVTDWVADQDQLADLSRGVLGSSTGAASALAVAADDPDAFAAIVTRGGRPDLAMEYVGRVQAPTLMIVGSRDPVVLDLNHAAANRMKGQRQIAVVPGATHLFPEEGALHQVAQLACGWFSDHLGRATRELRERRRRSQRRSGPYRNRLDAGERLAEAVMGAVGRFLRKPIVLALPRGGVEVAAPVARALAAPLDIVVSRKVGVPWQPELAMGAVDEAGGYMLDDALVARLEVPGARADELVQRAGVEARHAADRFRDGEPPPDLTGRDVILVDDGYATGMTARVGAAFARQQGARRIILAVPVAPANLDDDLPREFDQLVCPYRPPLFRAVGVHYEEFPQLDDQDVVLTLREARLWANFDS